MQEEKILILIKKAELKVEKIANQILAPYDLTSTQLKIMVILYTNTEKSFRQTDLEKHFFLTNPTVTGILNNMEKKGLIERIKNPADSRSKVIVPTKGSFHRKEEMLTLYETLEEEFTENLTMAERNALVPLLEKLICE